MKLPKELKIKIVDFPDPAAMAKEIEAGSRGETEKGAWVLSGENAKEIVNMATAAWRIRGRVVDAHSGELKEQLSKEEVKKIARYLESFYDSLARMGVEVKDRTGEAFDYGLPEKVVTAQPQEGLSQERIIETLRPTIYWNHQIAQQGEVVIATPTASNNKEDEKR